jgi:predicted phage-related endonuclease
MSINELDAKVKELRELRNFEAEIKAAITTIEDTLKAEMLAKNTDVLNGQECVVTWKTICTSRFDSAAFKLTHADLFQQYSKATTSRRLVIA